MGLIRLLLAIFVFYGHAGQVAGIRLPNGNLAVECFFVISGFYMSLVMDKKYGSLQHGVWRTFMSARLARLYPAYAVVLLASFIAAAAHWKSAAIIQRLGMLAPIDLVLAILSNLSMIGQDVLLFTDIGTDGHLQWSGRISDASMGGNLLFIPPAWSISLEISFYVLAPLLYRWPDSILWAAFAASLSCRIGLYVAGVRYDPWTYRFFPAELMFFLAGWLSYKLTKHLVVKHGPWAGPVGLSVFLVAVMATPLAGEDLFVRTILPLLLAVAIPFAFQRWKDNALDRWVGNLSYPLYVSHVLALQGLAVLGIANNFLLALPVALAVSVTLLVTVESPIERWRQERIEKIVQKRLVVSVESHRVKTIQNAEE